ncbi:hypothetical protein FRC02_009139 [Tulasnella sp. 418]|nr:hypothetical protein FRC02_009139 [Tulasnella sp. 418]
MDWVNSSESYQLNTIAQLKSALSHENNLKQTISQIRECTASRYTTVIEAMSAAVRENFCQLPDVQEDIIDIAYDLTEDEALKIRLLGYRLVSELSRLAPSWARRNVDILVQLLAQDGADDLRAITSSICEHMQIDAMATFQVLCQYGCSAESDDLRGTVLSFLSQDSTKVAFLEDLDSSAALAYRDGLLSALMAKHVGLEDSVIIVEDLLLPFSLPADFVDELIAKLIDKANACSIDQAPTITEKPVSLSSLSFIALAESVKQQKKSGLQFPFLKFYAKHATLSAISNLDKGTQENLVLRLAAALRAVHEDQALLQSLEYKSPRDNVATHCSTWIQVIIASNHKLWNAALPLSTTILHRCRAEGSWKPDCAAIVALRDAIPHTAGAVNAKWQSNLTNILKEILERVDHESAPEVNVISIVKPPSNAPISKRKRKTPDMQTSTAQPPATSDNASARPFGLPARPAMPQGQSTLKSNLLQRINISQGETAKEEQQAMSVDLKQNDTLPAPLPQAEMIQPPSKRRRKGKETPEEPPSLLSRMRDPIPVQSNPQASHNAINSRSTPKQPLSSTTSTLRSRLGVSGLGPLPTTGPTATVSPPKFTPIDQMQKSRSISIKGLSATQNGSLTLGVKS